MVKNGAMLNLIDELKEQVDKIDAIDDNITEDQYIKFHGMVADMVAFAETLEGGW
jgi:CRISPR/Cas system CSM-associated protein Csm2 small subunit